MAPPPNLRQLGRTALGSLRWAIAFGLADALWLVLIYALSLGAHGEHESRSNSVAALAEHAITIWNAVHAPIRRLVEPALFPIVSSHPPHPDTGWFMLYYVVCVLQSVLLGYVVGLLVRAMHHTSTTTAQ